MVDFWTRLELAKKTEREKTLEHVVMQAVKAIVNCCQSGAAASKTSVFTNCFVIAESSKLQVFIQSKACRKMLADFTWGLRKIDIF